MFPNFLKITLRNLRKSSTYSTLNIFGLSLGIVSAGLIFLWVEDELHFNHYFSNSSHIYMVKNQQAYDQSVAMVQYTPGPLAPAMQSDIPGIKNVARSSLDTKSLFTKGDKSIYEDGRSVDPAFLSLFKLQFVQGSPATAFQQLQSVVISEKMAKTFFSNGNAYGQTIALGSKKEYTITGVIKDLPSNVSLQFDYLIPYAGWEISNPSLKYWGNQLITWVELDPATSLTAVNRQLSTFIHEKQSEITNEKLMLYPLSRIRLYNTFDKSGNETEEGRIKYVRLFSMIGVIILVIACINFMNLATARSEKRAKEVGVRKVMGATKNTLIGQFTGEAIILSIVATLLAIFLIYLLLPAFNLLVEKRLTLDLFNPVHLLSLIAIAFICGLLAGSYPAFYLSSFSPIRVLKSLKQKEGGAAFIRKALVVTQFAASVIFIICAVVIYQQITYTKQRDIGFNRQNLIISDLQGNMKPHFAAIKNALINSGAAENASLSIGNTLEGGYSADAFHWTGQAPSQAVLISYEKVSPEYIGTMKMQLQAGTDFHSDPIKDSDHIIINETLARLITAGNGTRTSSTAGNPAATAIGSIISSGNYQFTVIGVVRDFNFGNIFQPAAPFIMFADTSNVYTLTMRLKANADLEKSLAKVSAVMKTANPGYPFDYKFLDDEFNNNFKAETLTGKLAALFSALAIIISCIGLFGLAAYTAERRTKEIGIRKVLGASVAGVTGLLSKDFLRLVAISCIIAFPVAGWIMHNWLRNYQYRITLSAWLFVATGLLVMLIALATVSVQAIRAAWANPVKSLRSE